MASISTTTGLISGIDSKNIIDQLISLEGRSKTLLETRVEATNKKKLAFTDLQTRLSTIRLTGTTLKKPSTFQGTKATSGNEDVLTATTGTAAAVGNYQFQVARLVTTQQSVSNGFSDFDSTNVGAGTITMEMGGGELTSQTLLSELHGGKGVARGRFRITDRSGASTVIDTSAAVTVDDVLRKINTALDVSVKATVDGDKIKLTDLTGKTTSNLAVQDMGTGTAAADLGLVASVASNTLTGADVQHLARETSLSVLNDNRGVRVLGGTANDFSVTTQDGTTFNVSLASAKTVGDVLDAINTAGAGKVTAKITGTDNHIDLQDNTVGGSTLAVTALGGSNAAADLGLTEASSGGLINGYTVLSTINSVLVKSLRGGTGMPLGTISIQDRAGASANVDLSGARTVQEILDRINNAAGINITASLKSSQNGISITDDTGGTGNLVIGDVSGTSASVLGLAGTFGLSSRSVEGANMQKAWVTRNSLLSTLNGGKGIAKGKFKITNAAGVSATVDLSQGNEITIKDVLAEINAKGIGVVASVNANGDGLLLTDSSGGAGKMKVEEVDGSTAADLNIKGTATTTTIDGSWEKSITITATDKLKDIQTKINDAGFGMSAAIINDGSGLSPFRLSLTARNTGRGGRVSFDGGATGIRASTLVESQDAAVFLGGTEATAPMLITASKNQLSGVVPGVTIDLLGVSSEPVSLAITRSSENVVEQMNKFVENFNGMIEKIAELTKFDAATNEKGLLLGDATVQQVEMITYSMLSTVVDTGGKYRLFADVGIKMIDGGQIEFDEEKFRAAYADSPETVSKLFTMSTTTTGSDGKPKINYQGIAGVLEEKINKLIDPVNGVVTQQNKTLDQTVLDFQKRITQMDAQLVAKRARLERQFSQMESVLAGLQSQQTALSSFQPVQQMRSRNSG